MKATLPVMRYKSVQETVPVLEVMINAAKDRVIRDQLVVRLARFDQENAALRNMMIRTNPIY